ncbi:hypothetical protein [Mesorhizobium sp. Z1-4]|uniref:hypothetical protein n=1 Tax=Mesorhizobium sp. Z1-4 TaxID=2448478 RepID=UPI000FDAE2F7|nr:hypothetical protein [Mesorhizobium sp. Z1-4]
MTDHRHDSYDDRLRLLLLLDACEVADISPVPIMRFHALAFLANVLGPVWSLDSYEGKILKRRGGPFYPELQEQLDHLVGLGLVTIHNIGHSFIEGRWRLEGEFALNAEATKPLIDVAASFSSERRVMAFLRRLAIAASQISEPIEVLVGFDATWSDQRTGTGDVIDFSEWRRANYSAYAIQAFEQSIAKGVSSTRGDRLQVYMRYLERRLHGTA